MLWSKSSCHFWVGARCARFRAVVLSPHCVSESPGEPFKMPLPGPQPRGSGWLYGAGQLWHFCRRSPGWSWPAARLVKYCMRCPPPSPHSSLPSQLLPTPLRLPAGHLFQTFTHNSSLTEFFPVTVHSTYQICCPEVSSCFIMYIFSPWSEWLPPWIKFLSFSSIP